MADPVTIAMIGMGASAAAGGVSAFGSIMGGQAQAGMYEYQAGLAKMNAQIAQQNARYALQTGEAQAMRSGMKSREQMGETLTRQAASGIDVNQGTGVRVRQSEQQLALYDQAAIRSTAARQAYGYRAQGFMDEQQSILDQYAAKNAKTAGYIGAASSILGAAGSVSSKWMQGQQVGLWGSGSDSQGSSP
jgi:hypothetical protein